MSVLLALGALILVVALAVFLRRGSAESGSNAPVSTPEDPALPEAEVEDHESDIELAITSDGAVFIPDGYSIRVIPLDPQEVESRLEDIEAGLFALSPKERTALAARQGKPGSALSVGDFTAARIRRGAADVVPWLVETLGRDGEYIPFPFETEDGARAALKLIESMRIVRRPLDDEGRPIPASMEDFEEARRRYDETWRELALEQEPGEGPGPPYSDRR